MKTQHLFSLFVVIVIISLISQFVPSSVEHFMIMSLATRDVCPTKNQSLDIRGDIPIPRGHWGINDSEFGPLNPEKCQNRPLV